MLFDSGAWLTLISNEVFDEQLRHKVKLKDPDVVPGGYGGQVIDLRGYFEAEIAFKSNTICGKVSVTVKGDSVLSWPHQKGLRVILDPNSPSPVMIKEDYVNTLHHICGNFCHTCGDLVPGVGGLAQDGYYRLRIISISEDVYVVSPYDAS
ncbi:hypothetical protein NDU88_005716 [Pleurodeles waltl]|uniref:Peptidase A2 domain-containing protein n=1 Tax=Pleurodeles waltl TaxID=8319 RepID=A0AAV7MA88_PLEWA|nr:hypothetical protein NDU88_005716 [Pleurodeles waltl]